MSHAAARILDFHPQDFIPESELVASDGVPLDSTYQRKQIDLATDVIEAGLAEQGEDEFHVGGNQFVYYSTEQARAIRREVRQLSLFPVPEEGLAPEAPPGKKHNRGPDVFVVRGGVERRKRKVWASWLEGGRLPDFVLEIQSPSTAHVDAGEKEQFYAEVFQAREYFYYGPDDPDLGKYRDQLVGLRLGERGVYEPIRPDGRGWILSEVLGFYVGRWDGIHRHEEERWIRLYDAQGRLVLTGEEAAEQRAEAELRLRKAAEQRALEQRRQKSAAEQRAAAAEAEVLRLKKLLESGASG